MSRIIHCVKLNEETEGLKHPPFPGELGERIFKNISQKAWNQWLEHQTMLINEYRLSMLDIKAKAFLREEMNKFFFGEGSEKPTGFTKK